MFKLISTDRLLENYLVYTNMKICQGENKEFVLSETEGINSIFQGNCRRLLIH